VSRPASAIHGKSCDYKSGSPAPNNAGLSFEGLKMQVVSCEGLAELFSCLFYVAASRLNSPRFVAADY
jgi:hypothetical protein